MNEMFPLFVASSQTKQEQGETSGKMSPVYALVKDGQRSVEESLPITVKPICKSDHGKGQLHSVAF